MVHIAKQIFDRMGQDDLMSLDLLKALTRTAFKSSSESNALGLTIGLNPYIDFCMQIRQIIVSS